MVTHLKVSREKTHYLGKSAQKSKAAHPVNYFPGFLGKNIKNCPPSKLFLFTSLLPCISSQVFILLFLPYLLHLSSNILPGNHHQYPALAFQVLVIEPCQRLFFLNQDSPLKSDCFPEMFGNEIRIVFCFNFYSGLTINQQKQIKFK